MSDKKSPRAAGVSYFNHFPRQRLRPYGEISTPTPDYQMLDKASVINCEYLVRPKVALSELAETVSANKAHLESELLALNTSKTITALEDFKRAVAPFNTRSGSGVTTNDVHSLLKYSIGNDDDEIDRVFDRMEHLGHMLYVVGSHHKMLRSLVRNPRDYSRKCETLPVSHEFKVEPGIKSLKTWWVQEAVDSQEAGPSTASYGGAARRNLLDKLEDCEEQSEYQRAKKRARIDKPAATALAELEDEDPIDEELLSPRKKKKKAKKHT